VVEVVSAKRCWTFANGWDRIETGREPTVKTAAHLVANIIYKNKDALSAGIIVAGWDAVDGGSIYNILAGGSCIKQTYALGGSGSIFIYGQMDSEYREGMTAEEARALVKKSISHAMARDGSSGGMIRTMVVTEAGNDRDITYGNALPFGPAFD